MLRLAITLSLLFSLTSLANEPAVPPTSPAPPPTTMTTTMTTTTTTTAAEADALAIVNKALLRPLRERDARSSMMSRARVAPMERRARMTDAAPRLDGKGDAFFAFAFDERHGRFDDVDAVDGRWQKDTFVGCVYPATEKLYIKRGDRYVPASTMLGKKPVKVPDHTCVPDATRQATATTTTMTTPAG